MIDLRYNLSMLAYKLKDKLNRKKGHDEEDIDERPDKADYHTVENDLQDSASSSSEVKSMRREKAESKP